MCSARVIGQLPRVAMLSTGGTIASKYNSTRGGYETAFTGEDLVAAVPAIRALAQIQVEQISNIPSWDITCEIWLRLAKRVNDLLAMPEISGVVVTHGTDTLEETAYFLDLTTTSSKPVILVGAQRPASDSSSDGPQNLVDAVRVVLSPEAINKGTLVVMNGQINPARDVTKSNTIHVEAFRSFEFGQLGVVDEDGVHFYRATLRRQTIPIGSEATLGRVEIIMNYAGADGFFIRDSDQIKGLVVAGTGLGSVSSSMYDAIKEARTKGVLVVISTRVPTGRVFSLSAMKGSSLTLKQIGCVLADNLSPPKARVLLMLALTKTCDPKLLQKYFDS